MASSSCAPSTFSPFLYKFRARNSIAMVGLLSYSPKTPTPISLTKSSFTFISLSTTRKPLKKSFQVRSVAAPTEAVSGFDDMVSETKRKYYMLGGKGGVGKTSCAASLAVKFAKLSYRPCVQNWNVLGQNYEAQGFSAAIKMSFSERKEIIGLGEDQLRSKVQTEAKF